MLVPPLPTEQDARSRALRTLAQGLTIDVAVAVLAVVVPLLLGTDFAFTRDYWTAIGILAAKTALHTAASYLMRRLVPPPPGQT